MQLKASLSTIRNSRGLKIGSAWKIALLAGFVVQLLLILFVTGIGIEQLAVSKDSINNIVDVHMRKQTLTKAMVFAARERTVTLFRLVESDDAFERDELYLQFGQNAADFINARNELLSLPLSSKERELLERQGILTGPALPIQNRIVDQVNSDSAEAEALLLKKAIPAQNRVLDVLSQLDAETQKIALDASGRSLGAHAEAKFWMITLSGIALSLGLFVAAAVIYYTNRASREREHLATHDAMTGLPNRMLFKDRLDQALARAQRRGSLVGVLASSFLDRQRVYQCP